MGTLFEIDVANGNICLNQKYKQKLQALFTQIKCTLIPVDIENNTEKTIRLNAWSYRLSDTIWHSFEFSRYEFSYTLTLSESKFVAFSDFSFNATEGEVCVYDSVDVNGFIHYLHQYMKNERISLIFSFSNSCN